MSAFENNIKEFHKMIVHMYYNINTMDIEQIIETMMNYTTWYRTYIECDMQTCVTCNTVIMNMVEYIEFYFMKIRNSLKKSGVLDVYEPFMQIGNMFLNFKPPKENKLKCIKTSLFVLSIKTKN